MNISVEETKKYLRVDYDEEDELIRGLIDSAVEIVASVSRIDKEAVPEMENETIRVAVLYTVAYLYEHREEADHHDLMVGLRNLLMGVRKAGF
jgi:uncharacterized phage protein (predicted DNA packaging)